LFFQKALASFFSKERMVLVVEELSIFTQIIIEVTVLEGQRNAAQQKVRSISEQFWVQQGLKGFMKKGEKI
jgi:hypothetical protein